ncbi:hypothetical protein [Vagococcus fluvialis]
MSKDGLTDEQREKEMKELHEFMLDYLEEQEQKESDSKGANYN